tara:strand:- start:326 stop:571 length:246 start_codon:yes stop_codon:yes gene_type:complete
MQFFIEPVFGQCRVRISLEEVSTSAKKRLYRVLNKPGSNGLQRIKKIYSPSLCSTYFVREQFIQQKGAMLSMQKQACVLQK